MARRRPTAVVVLGLLAAGLLAATPAAVAGTNAWTRAGLAGQPLTAIVSTSTGLYAGTPAGGVKRSTDGGVTWSGAGLDGLGVSRLVPDPADAATLYAIVDGDAFAGGTLRRTTDSGATWNAVDVPGAAERDVAVVAGNLYAATTGGIYVSADNGGSWTLLGLSGYSAGRGPRRVTVAPTDSDRLYSAVMIPSGHQVWRSTDGGATWSAAGAAMGTDSLYSLAVDPADAARVYAASATGPFRSSDGAETWEDMGSSAYGVMATSAGIAFATSAGAFVSRDGGLHWTGLSLSGLDSSSYAFKAVAFADGDANTIYAATADGAYAFTTVAPLLPTNVTPPSITGTPQVGELVVCDAGTWNDADSLAREWLLDGQPTSGTDSRSITAGDIGRPLVCRVSATSGAGIVQATTAIVTPVAAPVAAPDPGGDTSSAGGTNPGGPGGGAPPSARPASPPPSNAPRPAPATPPAAVAAPRRVSAPRIAGKAVVGRTLSCAKGTWTGTALTFRYGWTRNGKRIAGATTARYRLKSKDTRRRIACLITASNAAGSANATTRPTAQVRNPR
jgi:hypothetical protein